MIAERLGFFKYLPLSDVEPTSAAKLRISLITPLPPALGIADYSRHLAEALAAVPDLCLEIIDFKALYPLFLYPGGKNLDITAPAAELPLATVRRRLSWFNPFSWIGVGLGLQGDVVHAQCWNYALAPLFAVVLFLAKMRGRKVVITLHNVRIHDESALQQALHRLVLRFADRCIVHAPQNAVELATFFPSSKIAVISNGPYRSFAPITQTSARENLGLPQKAKVILFFGNIRPYKGLEVLLRAFRDVLIACPAAKLLIAGNLWESWQPYQKLIEHLGLENFVITHLRYIPDKEVGGYFSACDIVVLPYLRFSGCSGVGARALFHSKPMIVSNVGGLPQLVRDESAVFPAGDSATLGEILLRVLNEPEDYQRLVESSRTVAQDSQWHSIAQSTAELYREMLCRE